MRPKSWQLVSDMLVVLWDDGHESYYPGEKLRRACPCAMCSGEPDLFGRMSIVSKAGYRAESFQMESVTPTGNYALQPNFADGHTFGIWTWDRLRAHCDCGACRR